MKAGPGARGARGRDRAVVPVHDPLDQAQSEPDAESAGRSRRIPAVKPLEDVGHARRAPCRSRCRAPRARRRARLSDSRTVTRPPARGELERVVEQIQEQPLDPRGVSLDRRARRSPRHAGRGPAPGPPARAARRPTRRSAPSVDPRRAPAESAPTRRAPASAADRSDRFSLSSSSSWLAARLALVLGRRPAASPRARSRRAARQSACAARARCAVLNCRISPTASSTRASVSLNACATSSSSSPDAAHRQALLQVGGVDRAGRGGEPLERRQRDRPPSSVRRRPRSTDRPACPTAAAAGSGAARRPIAGERRADLQQVDLRRRVADDHAVGQADAAVVGLDVVQPRLVAKRLHLARREGRGRAARSPPTARAARRSSPS